MEKLVHYTCPTHPFSLLSALNAQRLEGRLCDVTLIVGDQKFLAHRSVLVASCGYFRALFSGRDADGQSVVQLDCREPEVFENVLNYIYSASLFLSKQSLPAVQELGYILGIPFLINIMAEKPQVSYSVSRNMIISEENGAPSRSVDVSQDHKDNPGNGSSQIKFCGPQERPTSLSALVTGRQSVLSVEEPCQLSEHDRQDEALKNTLTTPCHAVQDIKMSFADKPRTPVLPLEERVDHTACSQLPETSSGAFSKTQTQQAGSPEKNTDVSEDLQLKKHKHAEGYESHELMLTDTVGPLNKSPIRGSVSPDSPVLLPLLRFNKGESVEKSAPTNSTDLKDIKQQVNGSKPFPVLLLTSQPGNADKTDIHQTDVPVKPEPSSPLADTSDIIRVVIGDSFPAEVRNLSVGFDDEPDGVCMNDEQRKRKATLDTECGVLKKFNGTNDDASLENNEPGFTVFRIYGDTLRDSKVNRVFKCSSCFKVLRSNAGLRRHVNMFHNPEKLYACDICHKQFHTKFKVWTHCQTQHGLLQNPVFSSISHTVLDETSHHKSAGLVQERELRRSSRLWANKSGSTSSQMYSKKNLRTWPRNHTCPQCGKIFRFPSRMKQHLKLHSDGKSDCAVDMQRGSSPVCGLRLQNDKPSEACSCRQCREKLSSPNEQGEGEQRCRYTAACPYCSLHFSNSAARDQHETHCEYRKLTCLECMRTFKSSFSIWRHQTEVHNQNTVAPKDLLHRNDGVINGMAIRSSRDEAESSDSSELVLVVSEDGSLAKHQRAPPRRQKGKRSRELPQDKVDSSYKGGPESLRRSKSSLWSCEKCGKAFGTCKQMERHQELLCYVKPFICHICNKSFRTNFRLWSHIQSHRTSSGESCSQDNELCPPTVPSPPPTDANTHSPPVAEAGREKQNPAGGLAPVPKASEPRVSSKKSRASRRQAADLSGVLSKRQYMCKVCQRTFRTAFSLWSHERTHKL